MRQFTDEGGQFRREFRVAAQKRGREHRIPQELLRRTDLLGGVDRSRNLSRATCSTPREASGASGTVVPWPTGIPNLLRFRATGRSDRPSTQSLSEGKGPSSSRLASLSSERAPARAAILTQRLTLVGFFISKADCDVAVTLLNPPTVEKNCQLLRCFRPLALAI